jgi:hypothetical protein
VRGGRVIHVVASMLQDPEPSSKGLPGDDVDEEEALEAAVSSILIPPSSAGERRRRILNTSLFFQI